jgi:PAS domain S-box-containing protein
MSVSNHGQDTQSAQDGREDDAAALFAGPGEMRALCRALDWAATPLGPVGRWPTALRVTARLVLAHPFPTVVLWGPALVQLYNDGYREIMGARHPAGLGQPTRECWPEVWHVNAPLYERVRRGESVSLEDARFPIERAGGLEEAWFTLSYSPAYDDAGDVAGVLLTIFETTEWRRQDEAALRAGEARQAFLLQLSDALRAEPDADAAANRAIGMLAEHLRLDRCWISEVFEQQGTSTVGPEYRRPDLAPMAGTFRLSDYPETMRRLATQPMAVHDAATDPRFSDAEKALLAGLQLRALLVVPLRKGSRVVSWALAVATAASREWTDGEQVLLENVAERVWGAIERARAEAAVHEREARFRLLGEAAPMIVSLARPDGRIEYVNPFWTTFSGRSADDFASGDWLEAVHPDDRAAMRAAWDDARAAGRPYADEFRARAADGTYRWLRAHGAPVRDAAGAVTHWVNVAADIHDRRRAEEVLRENEERYRLIVEGARDYAILTVGPEGRIQSWSPGAEAVFGWTAGEAVGQPVAITFVPEDRDAGVPEGELRGARREGAVPDVRWHQRRDGARVFIEGTTRALRDGHGMLRGFLKVGQDVTRRRELDEALRASEARYRALVENVRDYAIYLLDPDGVVTEWTAGAERVTGYPAAEAVGRPLARFYTPEDAAAGVPERHLAEAARAGRGEWEGWRVRKDGTRFWANEIATAVRDEAGRLTGFTKISRDLTEQRLTEEAAEQRRRAGARDELRRALARAEEGERRRLARELHDQLGQHLTALALGLADVRRRLHAPERGPGAVETIEASLDGLEALARAMTRDARALALELRPPELDDVGLVSAVETYVREWAARAGVAAEVAVTGARERAVPPDAGSALYRILQEALTNVARHASATQVSVIVEQPDGDGRPPEVRLIVEDDGRGFDPDATAARVRRERRLGLAGMRERAALVGGTVTLESSPGAGTTVFVRLPVERAEDAPSDAGAAGADPAGAGNA